MASDSKQTLNKIRCFLSVKLLSSTSGERSKVFSPCKSDHNSQDVSNHTEDTDDAGQSKKNHSLGEVKLSQQELPDGVQIILIVIFGRRSVHLEVLIILPAAIFGVKTIKTQKLHHNSLFGGFANNIH
jgi:hypothetical protein